MSRILFAWELGDNYGHLTKDLAVAQDLRARGHAVDFMIRDTRIGDELLSKAGFSFLQAPLPQCAVRLVKPPVNYADILAINGYADRPTLSGLVRSWRSVFDHLQPDVVVIDHAPTALLAACLHGIPAGIIGNGFEVPPPLNPLPPIRPWEAMSIDRLRAADAVVLSNINAVTTAGGGHALSQLSELFAGQTTRLTTFSELDHFGARRDGEYVGPIGGVPHALTVPWQTEQKPRVFAYLHRSLPGLEALLSALQDQVVECTCVIPELPVALKKQFESKHLHLVGQPITLEAILPMANVAIASGSNTIAESLLAGVPLLLVPESVEQYLAAARVEALGAGLMIRTARSQTDFASALDRILTDKCFAQVAQRFAQKYQGYNREQTILAVASFIERVALRQGK